MTTEVWKAFHYFCNTHNLTFWVIFQENCYKTAHSYTGQRYSLSSVMWAKVLEQPQVTTALGVQTDPPWLFWASHRSALKRWTVYSCEMWRGEIYTDFWCTYEVLVIFWCQPCAPSPSASAGLLTWGALCKSRFLYDGEFWLDGAGLRLHGDRRSFPGQALGGLDATGVCRQHSRVVGRGWGTSVVRNESSSWCVLTSELWKPTTFL